MHSISSSELGLSFDAMTAGLMLVTLLALRVFPGLWNATVGGIDQYRIHTLDGARGLLTTWVLTHHMMMVDAVDANNVWHPPAGALGVLMVSGFFVAPFFMLTAMLFGGRMLARPGRLDVGRFLIGRAFRLVPAYLVAVVLLVLGALASTRFALHRPLFTLFKEIARWTLFDFVTRYDINGVDLAKQYGILWTLRYEILFYAVLPVFALLQRWSRSRLILIPGLAVLGLLAWPFIYFAAGTVAALGMAASGARARIGWQVGAVAGIAVIVGVAMAGHANHWLQAACLIPSFVSLALELPLFAPLRWRPFRLIGEASYSNYVLHGPILFLGGMLFFDTGSIVALPFVQRMAGLIAIGSLALMGAVASFVFVELPCVRLGAAITGRLRSRSAGVEPGAHLAGQDGAGQDGAGQDGAGQDGAGQDRATA